MHLNFWINEYYEQDSWREKLKKKRLDDASDVFDKRKGKNEDLSLLECLQLSDKKVILKATNEFLKEFNFSKTLIEKLLKDIEKIRNELVHSQNSIISNLEWKRFVRTISNAELFLYESEKVVEEKARTPNKV